MNVNSIDNMYEDDGIELLSAFFAGLNAESDGPKKRILVALIPEYDDNDKLQRIDCVTVTKDDQNVAGLGALMSTARTIIADRKRRDAEALEKLDKPIEVNRG